jgi:hypothetical protein
MAMGTAPQKTAAAPAKKVIKQPKPLPTPNSDLYELYEILNADELAIQKRVRADDGLVEGSRLPAVDARATRQAHRRRSCRGGVTLRNWRRSETKFSSAFSNCAPGLTM